MTDERVDELLKDLDAALSVEPAPSVAARVRTRIDEPSAHGSVGWRLAVAAGMAATIVAYGVWPRDNPTPAGTPQQARSAIAAPEITNASLPSSPAFRRATNRPVHVPGTKGRARTGASDVPPVREAASREREVIVSPQIGLAFEQLQAAARSGRLTAESFAPSEPRFEPAAFAPGTVVIQRVEIDTVPLTAPVADPGPDGPGGSENKPGPKWPNRPLPRTRSTS